MSRELDLSAKAEELYLEAYQFRRDYRCDHKVRLILLFSLLYCCFQDCGDGEGSVSRSFCDIRGNESYRRGYSVSFSFVRIFFC